MLPYTFNVHPADFKSMLLRVIQENVDVYHRTGRWVGDQFRVSVVYDYCEHGNLHALKHILNELGNGINWKNPDGLCQSEILSKRFHEQPRPIQAILQEYPKHCLMYNRCSDEGWVKMSSDTGFFSNEYYRMVPNINIRFTYVEKKVDNEHKPAILPSRPIHALDSIEV